MFSHVPPSKYFVFKGNYYLSQQTVLNLFIATVNFLSDVALNSHFLAPHPLIISVRTLGYGKEGRLSDMIIES